MEERPHRLLAIALIRRVDDEKTRWLVQHNESSGNWDVIRATRLEGESPIEAINREVAWRLDLNRDRDFVTSKMALLNVDRHCDPEAHQKDELSFFPVEIYRSTVLEKLAKSDSIRWVPAQALIDGIDGQDQIDPEFCQWNQRWQIIRPWIS